MPLHEPGHHGHVRRSHPSLSCVICRRRKVRCGREQPACNNCVRIQEICEYEADVRDRSTAQAKHKLSRGPVRGEASPSRPNPRVTEETWSGRAEKEGNPIDVNKGGSLSKPTMTIDKILSASSSSDQLRANSSQSSNPTLSQTSLSRGSDLYILQSGPPDLGSEAPIVLSGDISATEDLRLACRMTEPSIVDTAIRELGSETPRKRPRASSGPAPLKRSSNSHNPVQPLPANREDSIWTSTDDRNSEGRECNVHSPGYLSIRSGGQIRHVGNGFWGLITGHESLCDTFLGEPNDVPDNVPQPHIDSLGLANLLKKLPPKVVCDALLQSFSINVHPIVPLVHFSTLQKDYNNFWQWCRNSDISQPDNKLLGDPTFLCLLFSTLYCGAITALPALWTVGSLEGSRKGTLVEQLQDLHSASLKACDYLRHPTFFTLVSTLLAHSCSEPDIEPSEELSFLSSVVRSAQSMGLHHDGTVFGLDTVTCELRRRVWWHIVWLDVQASILHGSQTWCGSSKEVENFRMATSTRDEDLFLMNQSVFSRSSSPSSRATSITMLLAIGRFESARFKHFLLSNLSGIRIGEQARLDECIGAANSLQTKLDELISKVPAQGIPETGVIPSRLVNASPMTHERLYGDHPSQPTIWSSWVVIMLTMLKSEAVILVQKPYLGRADSKTEQQQKFWNSIVQLCISYLGNFMQLIRIPAFAPFSWFCINNLAPLQFVFLCLTYMQYNRNPENSHNMRYLVDQVIDIFASSDRRPIAGHEEGHNPAISDTLATDKQISLAWRMLVLLRKKIDLPPGADQPLFKPAVLTRCDNLPAAIALRTMSLSTNETFTDHPITGAEPAPSGRLASHSALYEDHLSSTEPPVAPEHNERRDGDIDMDNMLEISDLAEWPSSLIQEPEEYFHIDEGFVNGVNKPADSALGWDLYQQASL